MTGTLTFGTDLERRLGACVALASELVRTPSEDPPGDTGAAAAVVEAFLAAAGVAVVRFEPAPGRHGIVARLDSGRPGPRLVYCAHLDVFPVGDRTLWSFDPFSGAVRDGHLLGRGASDMKGALAASVVAFLALREAGLPERGAVSLLLVSDEETGGAFGTEWALSNMPDLVGDACVIGEPSGPDVVRVGEKGQVWVRLEARGDGYHGGIADGSESGWRLLRAAQAVGSLARRRYPVPPEHAEVVRASESYGWTKQLAGREWLFTGVSVNLGLLGGGVKVNMSPTSAVAELDLRLPFGAEPAAILEEIAGLVAPFAVVITPLLAVPCAATISPLDSAVVRAALDAAGQAAGRPVPAVMAPTYTDARFFRRRGVPAVVYGPRPHNMGGADESVAIDDLRRTLLVHGQVGWRLLGGAA